MLQHSSVATARYIFTVMDLQHGDISLGRFEYKMLQVVVFNSESDTQFFDTQDGGEKKRARRALEMVVFITYSVCLVPWSSRIRWYVIMWVSGWLFFALLLGNHQAFQVFGVDHASVNFEFPKGIINFGRRELFPPGHQ